MSREELSRFLTDEGRAAVAQFTSESQDQGDDFDIAEALDRNLYDALVQYDSRAGLSRWLSLRFAGPHAQGRMDQQALEDVLRAFRHEMDGASATKDSDLLKLDFIGFTRGSAILHLAPADAADIDPGDDSNDEQQALVVGEDQIDHALGVVTELHALVEGAGDMQRFAGQDGLLKGFEALADVLDNYDLDMGITWRNRTGRHRSAELTSQGREYARRYLERSGTSEEITVTGRVVEMEISGSGSFAVKAGVAKNSRKYTISTGSEESLLSLHLELGRSISVRVRRKTDRNRVGVTFNVGYEFMYIVTGDEPTA